MKAFAGMQTRLRAMITDIKGGAQQLLESAREIAHTSEALTASAHEQSHSASSMAATVEELTVSIGHVATSANEAHAISTDSGKLSTDGGAVIQNTLHSMSRIAGTVQHSAQQIGELGRHIEQITSVVNVISAIAEQTNLLALNAAIEAARAGEQGRGFAVVADEVRLLAQRTGTSTSEIGDMIGKIQSSAQEAVSQMDVGVEQVNQGLELTQSANVAIEQIRGGSGRIIGVVDQISMALNEQTAASQDVARSVERIAQMAQESSERIRGAAQGAANIEQLAHALDRQVAQFRL
ncbi:methyl-accepting chemotaxis protein [Pseudomonas entomophila]|uniref:methyl-accepting chemotaxis protein n=1 Tax=Pseudomonas entomophila TaxID=312306 RepID=UPI0035C1F052